jgi:uncharacterized protein with GYD domain
MIMATYIALVNFTEQGVRDFRSTADRAGKFKAMAEEAGVKVKDIFWTMGNYDIVLVLEAADEKMVVGTMLGLASLGNVRTQTLRAFNAAEMKEIISKAPKGK